MSKRYRIWRRPGHGMKGLLLRPQLWLRRAECSEFVALERVSLEVARGEMVGLLGANGAGKSTLLGLAAGLIRPSEGRVALHGRITPLLGLGAGFMPELSGRRNAILSGVLLGLRRREIERELAAIVEFSGLGEFIDQPLKTYSSGVQVRLGFAVAVHANPEVLLIDEVLAVGDAEFSVKCLARMEALRAQGAAILVASHNLHLLETLCDRALYLERGRLIAQGDPRDVAAHYRERTLPAAHAGGSQRSRAYLGPDASSARS